MKRTFDIDPYGAKLVFVFDEPASVAKGVLRKAGCQSDDISGEYSGLTVRIGHLKWMVYIPSTKLESVAELLQVLVHESSHVTTQLFQACEIDSEESYAYTVDHVFGMMFKAVYGKRKEIIHG